MIIQEMIYSLYLNEPNDIIHNNKNNREYQVTRNNENDKDGNSIAWI